MALKDLVAQKAALTEEAIEEIVSTFVRFDPEESVIAFTPAAAALQNRSKVLVYLVALQGWPFVTDKPLAVDAKPAEISEQVGVQGGTLRPILKELKDRHVISERGGRYFVRPVSLTTIKAELGNLNSGAASPKPRRTRKHSTPAQPNPKSGGARNEDKKVGRRSATGKTGNLAARFDKWIDNGFFDEPRTLADVQKRFHKEGALVPRTSIPGYLLKGLRSGRLVREEAEVNKKRVWVYQRQE